MTTSTALHIVKRTAAICLVAGGLCLGTFSQGAMAEDPTRGYVLNTSPSDLMGAHNARMLVVFGMKVEFKRYFLVDMLHQSMAVATEVSGGVRYDLRDNGSEKTLTIP